jgi:hypothetical protein
MIGLLNSTLALMPPQGHHHWTPFRPSVKQDFEKKTTHLTKAPTLRPTDPTTKTTHPHGDATRAKALGLKTTQFVNSEHRPPSFLGEVARRFILYYSSSVRGGKGWA